MINKNNTFFPNTFCIECIEKHYCRAMALAHEVGYSEEDRGFIIGELSCAELHCFNEHQELAKEIRDIRLQVQDRQESIIDWITTYLKINDLMSKELKEE